MPITRNSDQGSSTLQAFYLERSQEENDSSKAVGKAMLEFLDMINVTFKETQLWGLTSLYRLVIQAENDWKSTRYIVVIGHGNGFRFEYLLPPGKSPWEGARVVGDARSITEARSLLIIAMNECEGWLNNPELAELSLHLKANGMGPENK